MTESRSTRIWAVIAFVAVTGAFGSLLNQPNSADAALSCINADCGCNATQQQLNCSAQSGAAGYCSFDVCVCNPGHAGTFCQDLTGACCGGNSTACASNSAADCDVDTCHEETAAACEQAGGSFQGNSTTCEPGLCDPTATATATATATETATATATATPTQTRVPQGGDCVDASQCQPGLFCSDTVCCDTACAGAGQSCDVPGEVGTCVTEPAGAPAASGSGLAIIIGLLIATAFFALRARRN